MPKKIQQKETTLPEVVAHLGRYPIQAFLFVQEGLQFSAEKVHGSLSSSEAEDVEKLEKDRHVTGQQLCLGLRALARKRWGRMAAAVLDTWNVTRTEDFGEIVFSLVNAGLMRKRPQDSIDDFNNVYGFQEAFETTYKIDCQ